jgi:hypothetical protein
MMKKLLAARRVQSDARQEKDTIVLLERALRPAPPDRRLAKRIQQRLTAEWLARDLVLVLVGVAFVGLLFGALKGKR